MARVLVIDNSAEDRSVISQALREAGHEALGAGDAASALSTLRSTTVDAVITEWVLADSSALEFVAALRGEPRATGVRILVASAHSEPHDVARALDCGIDDYLVKASQPEELIARVNAALRRAPAGNGHVLQVGRVTLDRIGHRILAENTVLELAPAEFRLMAFFIEHPGRVFSRRQLLTQVWIRRKGIGERTVDVHVRRLRAALSAHGCEEQLQTVRGFGYRFGGP